MISTTTIFFYISANRTCNHVTISRISTEDKFTIQGDIHNTMAGDKVNVTCTKPVKIFTKDIWDGNATDNVLNVICRPDKSFDVPEDVQMPNCLARCPAEKPQVNASSYIKLDTTRTNDTEKLWEREKLW